MCLLRSSKFLLLPALAALLAVPAPVRAIIQPEVKGIDCTCEKDLVTKVASWSAGIPFPFWKNVGQIDRSTGIYMGNGYVLTAAHVGPGTFRTGDGKAYRPASGPAQYFKNFDESQADLCLFRIEAKSGDPVLQLPGIPLTTMAPKKGTPLVLIGGGAGQESSGRHFAWSDDYRVRWGVNAIEKIYSVTMPTSRFASFGYGTKFARGNGSCQAAPGDSGGAAFHFNPSAKRWELAGVIVAVDSHFGAAQYGNQTYIADPALFRKQMAVTKSGVPSLLASHP